LAFGSSAVAGRRLRLSSFRIVEPPELTNHDLDDFPESSHVKTPAN
jgi:hypothetical protein